MRSELNWAGNHTYRATRLAFPRSLAGLQELVASAPKLRALGSRHSFNDLADSAGVLVSLENLPSGMVVDGAAGTVSVGGGTRYGVLAHELQRRGYALHNLASLPHISVAGAVATATHGSGDANGNLATAVVGMDLILASGELLSVQRDITDDFDGMVVGLGALGIVSSLTLRIEPAFDVRQDVFTDIPWRDVLADFDAATSSAYSVSFFTDWRSDVISQAWLKSRTDAPGSAAEADALELLYPRWSDFRVLAERLDPERKFRNDFLERKVFTGARHPVSASGRATASAPGSAVG
ncbi:FAD-binding protein [Arthrobacter sp. Br18]|uniref:FAD-binding protein n=1 Tax=Arthrobacter sp. Br18 TaxID=1312954 RepID=UPI0004BC63F7|nr:FAD-binding protein [Arthrobacter sp. Br18]